MKPIKIPSFNITYADNQEEYQSLPAHKDEDGIVTTCWKLSNEERITLLRTGKIYLQIMTFNTNLQPQRMSIINPISDE